MKQNKKENNTEILWALIGCLVVVIVIVSLVIFSSSDSPTENCPMKKSCFKYIGTGGLLGSVEEKEVSCNKDYDFYRNTSIQAGSSCIFTYSGKGFD